MNKSGKTNGRFQRWRDRYLTYPVHPYKLLGLKISALGLIIGVIGALVSAYLMPTFGKFIFLLGVLIVLTGFAFTIVVYLTPEEQLPSKNKD